MDRMATSPPHAQLEAVPRTAAGEQNDNTKLTFLMHLPQAGIYVLQEQQMCVSACPEGRPGALGRKASIAVSGLKPPPAPVSTSVHQANSPPSAVGTLFQFLPNVTSVTSARCPRWNYFRQAEAQNS